MIGSATQKKHQPTGFFETAHYGLGSNQHLAHLDPITGAVLTVGGGKMQQVRSVLCQQRIAGEVGTKTTCKKGTKQNEYAVDMSKTKDLEVNQLEVSKRPQDVSKNNPA